MVSKQVGIPASLVSDIHSPTVTQSTTYVFWVPNGNVPTYVLGKYLIHIMVSALLLRHNMKCNNNDGV